MAQEGAERRRASAGKKSCTTQLSAARSCPKPLCTPDVGRWARPQRFGKRGPANVGFFYRPSSR
eukprot:9302988-Alexandrium_andersonii.AAC.1